ncbi:Rid family hydrolase [Mycolicibacterium iranicum]|uniref:Uncharacterized protein n=1 Tax=Mycolicibacterium iranicum TaxID=912594 RepID=A0A178M4S9_MYCIR|nr:Rid family hydrolase [Mycolicibacterium iranicum]OAN42183.1 hypothetical protein A4X20_00190 [Mycolicibacterium iranicum]
MPDVDFFVTPGLGETFRETRHHSQAVRIGDRVEISGQGGWADDLTFPDDLADEIVAAFGNVERVLATAGATWRDVVSVTSYHVLPHDAEEIGNGHNDVMIDQFRKRMGDRAPIWTEIGVTVLGAANMRIEIQVTAIVGNGE